MKTILLFLFTVPILFGQTGKYLAIFDSLKTGDTTYTYNFFGEYSEYWVTGNDTGASITDSVLAYGGTIRTFQGQAKDTSWVQLPVRDSTFSLRTYMAKANGNTQWKILKSNGLQLLKLVMTNAQYLSGRRWKFFIEAVKR